MVDARDSDASSPPASKTVTGTPFFTSCAAATRPTDPAPAIKTRCSLMLFQVYKRAGSMRARAGDNGGPDFRLDAIRHFAILPGLWRDRNFGHQPRRGAEHHIFSALHRKAQVLQRCFAPSARAGNFEVFLCQRDLRRSNHDKTALIAVRCSD